MKSKRRLTAMLLAGCLAVSSVPVALAEDAPEQQQEQVFTLADQAREDSKAAAPTEGTCGKNASWKLENGTLTISGTGEMSNYDGNDVPWYDNLSSITRVVIDDGITSIGDHAFEDCRNLINIIMPSSVTSIGYYAFSGCNSLTGVTIPDGVASIGESAFQNCSSLSSVTIPYSVTSIEVSAFSGCSSLSDITVSEQNKNYSSEDGVLFNKDKTELVSYPGGKNGSYSIPNSVTSILTGAFWHCSSLSGITIPDSVARIEDVAFSGCSSLTSVTIPDSVEYIGYSAFLGCPKIKNVIIPANTFVDECALGMGYNEDTEEYYVIDGFVATVTEGSKGERYCKEHGIKYETSHSFTNYVYNNDAQVGKDGTETAICDNGCGVTDTRIKKGTALPEPTTSVTEIFSDIYPSAWYIDYVQFVYDNGLMTGTSKTTFAPEVTLSRAMVAQVLYNYDKRVDSPYRATNGKTFKDVSKNDWFYEAIQWASANGIASGVGNGYFEPNSPVTREQVAQFLYNYNGRPSVSGNLPFSDADKVSGWAKNAMLWAYQNKIINGTTSPDGGLLLDPQGGATRAQAAAILTNYMRNMM